MGYQSSGVWDEVAGAKALKAFAFRDSGIHAALVAFEQDLIARDIGGVTACCVRLRVLALFSLQPLS